MSQMSPDENIQQVYLSIVSHELKTPVTSIQGFIQALHRRLSDKLATNEPTTTFTKEELQKNLEYISMSMRQIKRLNRLIDDLLDVSVMKTGQLSFTWNPIDLQQLIKDLTKRSQMVSTHHTIEFSPEQDHKKYVVIADDARLEKLFSNILNNAVKYSSSGTAIKIGVKEVPGYYQVSIHDEGVGIDEYDKDHIFELYYRGKNIDTNKISGLGLGLYLCKEIVEMHKGRIYFDSEPSKGTTFYVELPKSETVT